MRTRANPPARKPIGGIHMFLQLHKTRHGVSGGQNPTLAVIPVIAIPLASDAYLSVLQTEEQRSE